jgi:hemerythrin-like domain-containing protein
MSQTAARGGGIPSPGAAWWWQPRARCTWAQRASPPRAGPSSDVFSSSGSLGPAAGLPGRRPCERCGVEPRVEVCSRVCEYCGCQAIDAIAQLTAEHDIVVNLSGAALRALHAGALDDAAALAREIAAALAPHTRVEEGALFPAMAAEFGDHVRGLVDEHRLIEGVLAACADGTPTDPAWPDRLDRALAVLREHIIKEQDGLFPAALATLDPAQWDEVDAARAQPSALGRT